MNQPKRRRSNSETVDAPALRPLATVPDIVAALGGNAAVAELTQSTHQHVYNWRVADRLAAKTYLVLTAALAARGYEASPELWGMLPVPVDE